jgi:hypothetical protein
MARPRSARTPPWSWDQNGGSATFGLGRVTLADQTSQIIYHGNQSASNRFVGAGTIAKFGAGTLAFTGFGEAGADFTGDVVIAEGGVAFEGAFGDLTGNSARLLLGEGTILSGSGAFHGDVLFSDGARLAPARARER